jgi:hypothetical protein
MSTPMVPPTRADRKRCDHGETRLFPGKGPHYALLRCVRCGKFLKWVSKADALNLTEGDLADALNEWAAGR